MVDPPPPPPPIQSVHLGGHWSGDGWHFTLNGTLHRNLDRYEGHIEWTLQGFPDECRDPKWAKSRVGKSSTEYVRGTLIDTELHLFAHSAVDPRDLLKDDDGLLILSDYSIKFDEATGMFRGTSIEQRSKKAGELEGTISFQR